MSIIEIFKIINGESPTDDLIETIKSESELNEFCNKNSVRLSTVNKDVLVCEEYKVAKFWFRRIKTANRYVYKYVINNVENGEQSLYAETFLDAVKKAVTYLDFYSFGQNYEILEISLALK